MGPHTTSDDPSRYADPLQREEWAGRDPLARLEVYLQLSETESAEIAAHADQVAHDFRAACKSIQDPEPLSLFDNVYAAPHSGLARQRSRYAAYLEGLGS